MFSSRHGSTQDGFVRVPDQDRDTRTLYLRTQARYSVLPTRYLLLSWLISLQVSYLHMKATVLVLCTSIATFLSSTLFRFVVLLLSVLVVCLRARSSRTGHYNSQKYEYFLGSRSFQLDLASSWSENHGLFAAVTTDTLGFLIELSNTLILLSPLRNELLFDRLTVWPHETSAPFV